MHHDHSRAVTFIYVREAMTVGGDKALRRKRVLGKEGHGQRGLKANKSPFRRRGLAGRIQQRRLSVQEKTQLFPAAGMTQPVEGLFLNLADALAGDIEFFADLLQRVFRLLADAETQADNLLLSLGQRA